MKSNENNQSSRITFRLILLLALGSSLFGYLEIHSRAFQVLQTSKPQILQPQNGSAVVTGVVLDDKGVPLEKATVPLASATYTASALTQADGKFEFRNLAPAKYTITVQAARLRQKQTTVTIIK